MLQGPPADGIIDGGLPGLSGKSASADVRSDG